VRAVHEAYREAGAELLQANSFGGNRIRLELAGLAERVAEVNTAAVRLACGVARPTGLLVAGTIGPTGIGLLAGSGELAAAADAFAEQAAVLASAGVDLLLVETMVSVAEALVAVAAAQSQSAMPLVVTFAVGRDASTLAGDDIALAALRLVEAGVCAVGVNCGSVPGDLLRAIELMRAACPDLPLAAQPSAGLPRLIDGEPKYEIGPDAMAAWGCRLVGAGANLVGGCCGTTPEHIRAIAEAFPPRSKTLTEARRHGDDETIQGCTGWTG
jgi:methionine synthase I (cobalamin-dependent)